MGRRYGLGGPWVVRIEGPTGTGKSTLLALLARFGAAGRARTGAVDVPALPLLAAVVLAAGAAALAAGPVPRRG